MYTHFAPIGPQCWAVISHAEMVAEIALVNGRFRINTHCASVEDLDAIQTFAKDTQQRLGLFTPLV